MTPMPVSPYAVSKLAAEAYALSFQRCYDLPTLAFGSSASTGRCGPGHAYAAVVPAFTHAALQGRPLPGGDGSQTRDFTYVGTVVATLAEAVERRVTCPSPVNLAFGTRTSLLEVIQQLEELVGHELARDHRPVRAGDVPHSQADNGLLTDSLPGAQA